MSKAVKEATQLLEILPERNQDFALEFIKKTAPCPGSG